jgi:hypothetical protein
MKKIIIIFGVVLTGCAAITKEEAKVCSIAYSNYSSNEEKKWAYQEITKRDIHDKCSELASAIFYRQNNINSGTESNSGTGISPDASAALLQFGAQMMQQSQPRALIAAPPAPPAPIRTNCVTYANGMTSCNTW